MSQTCLAHLRPAPVGGVRRRRRHAPGRDHDLPLRPHPLPPGPDPPLVPAPRPLSRPPAPVRPARLRPADRLRAEEHRPHPGRRARADRLREFRRARPARLYEGVVEHFNGLREIGDADRPGLVVARAGHRAAEPLPGLHRDAHDAGRDRAESADRDRARARPVMARASSTGPSSGPRSRIRHGRGGRLCG